MAEDPSSELGLIDEAGDQGRTNAPSVRMSVESPVMDASQRSTHSISGAYIAERNELHKERSKSRHKKLLRAKQAQSERSLMSAMSGEYSTDGFRPRGSVVQSERLPLKHYSVRRGSLSNEIGKNRTSSMSHGSIGSGDDLLGIGEVEPATLKETLMGIVFGKGPVSLCLLAMPVALWAVFNNWSPTSIFWLNFLAMIPLAAILGDFTEEVALHTNQTIGGLINATFGNAVEVVVSIQALLANEIRVVQASLLGSIFSNLLLVLGCCFFFGGLYHKEQTFNSTAATANMGLLALSSIALVLPTPFAQHYNEEDEEIDLLISRTAAGFLMFMYLQLLFFQLVSHSHLFEDQKEEDDEDAEEASISLTAATVGLLVTTLLVAMFSEFLVGSIEGFTEASGVSRGFVGLIILPIVGNAVEHITAVTVAMKDKMDLAMGVAVGSSTQISLFVVPLTVLLGWALDRKMTLDFPYFEIILFVLSIVTVGIVVGNPKCNWLEGSLLVTTYTLIAVGFFFEKDVDAPVK